MSDAVVTKKPKESAVEVKAEIPVERLQRYRARAVKEIGSEISISGFRKGNIPEQILVKQVGEAAIMERTASIAISDELPELLAREKIIGIERPKVTITKLAPGNPIAFTALVSVMPEVELPDYKKIAHEHAAKKETMSVSDEEVADMERFLRRERARIERVEKGAEPERAHEEAQKLEEKDLPTLDDNFAKQLGADSADDLKKRMGENMLHDKERKSAERVREAIIEGLLAKMQFALPQVLIEHELDNMLNRLAHDLEHGGSTLEAYLQNVKKTIDELKKEWREAAEKRARVQIVLREIAGKEGIKAEGDEIAHELEHLKHHHPNIAEANLRAHIESALLPEAVFRWLEQQ